MIDEMRLLDRPPIPFDERPVRARFAGASVLVTGAGGSIGSALSSFLADVGVSHLTCVDHHEPSLFRLGLDLRERHPACQVTLALADVRDTPRLGRLIETNRIDALFHVAAYKHVPLAEQNCDQVVAVNVLSTVALADLAGSMGVRDFIYPSTDKAVRPPSIYGATKRLVELELLRRVAEEPSRRLAVARLVNVFGTAGNVVEVFSRRIAEGKPLGLTDARMTRYWMTRYEAMMLLTSAACVARTDTPLLADVGEPISIGQIAQRLSIMLASREPELVVLGSRPGERLHEELAYPFETLEPTELPGILRARPSAPIEDVSAAVAALAKAVEAGDDRLTRSILLNAVHAMVPAG